MAELLLDDGFEKVEVEAVVVGEFGTSGTTGGGFTNSLRVAARGERRSGMGLLGSRSVANPDGRRGRLLSKDRSRVDVDGPDVDSISTRDPPDTDVRREYLPSAPSERLFISLSSLSSLYSCSSNSASIR